MSRVRIGLKENLPQFALLVIINLFVGSMVGLERTVLPVIGDEVFGLASFSAALSFIVSFGFTKALVNLFAGLIADHLGRKRVLVLGWAMGIPVPLMVIAAPSWSWVVAANVLLGINQGLAWSMTVNMKLDLVTTRQRGIAMGFNEFAGYAGVSIVAALSGYVASQYALRPEPFYLGIGIAVVGLLLSLAAKDTGAHMEHQSRRHVGDQEESLSSREVFARTTLTNPTLSSLSLSGLVTNLKDGMAWGLFPIFFASAGLSPAQIGVVVAVYPAAWGIFQLFTGGLSDRIGRKLMIVGGMALQAISIWALLLVSSYGPWILASFFLGLGTAMVYPTLIAAIGDEAHPQWRASSLGVYRMWRDSGYAFGALLAGALADFISIGWAIGLVALLPLAAGINDAFRMKETLKK